MRRSWVWKRVAAVAVAAALAGVPALASAQSNFPSQGSDQGGNFPSQGGQGQGGGNFPSQEQPGRGGVFQSQQFGFAFEWGPNWELAGEQSEPGFEAVAIGNGVSTVLVMGVDIAGAPINPQQFVEQAAEGLDIPDLQFAEVIFDETDRAAAVYESPSQGAGIFLDAIRRDPQTMIVVMWQFPTGQFETEIEAFQTVMGGLTF